VSFVYEQQIGSRVVGNKEVDPASSVDICGEHSHPLAGSIWLCDACATRLFVKVAITSIEVQPVLLSWEIEW
jgi:hypothetical protein